MTTPTLLSLGSIRARSATFPRFSSGSTSDQHLRASRFSTPSSTCISSMLGSSPGRWGCYHPHPPQTRTCGFPASGSSRERFAPDGAFVGDLFDHPSDDAGRDSLVEEGGRPQSIWLSVVGSWTGSRGPESPRLFQANGSLLMAPPFPPSGPGEPGSPLSQVI